jgi:hypothetical protein
VSEFNVRYWRKQKDALLQTTTESWRAFGRQKSGKLPELDDEIFEHGGVCTIMVCITHEILHFETCGRATRHNLMSAGAGCIAL